MAIAIVTSVINSIGRMRLGTLTGKNLDSALVLFNKFKEHGYQECSEQLPKVRREKIEQRRKALFSENVYESLSKFSEPNTYLYDFYTKVAGLEESDLPRQVQC